MYVCMWYVYVCACDVCVCVCVCVIGSMGKRVYSRNVGVVVIRPGAGGFLLVT